MLSFSSKLAATLGAAAVAIGVTAPIAAAAPQDTKPAISWEDCPEQVDIDSAECGRIEVPTYYDNPDAGTISVGFVRVPAANPGARRGALFTNPGGPSGDAYMWAGNTAVPWPQAVRDEWDTIGVQPRGLPGSTPVKCDATATSDPIQGSLQVGKLTRDACEKNNPGYTNSLTTANTLQDWEMVRRALVEDKIDIAGTSYGTYLGSAYATKYPEHTGKVLLDSGMSPKLAWNGIFASQQRGYEKGLHDLLGFIAKNDAKYHLGTTPLQVYEKWSQKVAREAGVRPTVLPPNAKIGDLPPGLEFAGQPGADIMTATGPLRVQAEFLTQKIQHPNAVQVFSPLLVMTRDLVPIPAQWDAFAKHLNGSEPIDAGQPDPEALRKHQESVAQAMNMQNLIVCNENTVPGNPLLYPSYLWTNFVSVDPFTLINSLYGSGAGCGGRAPVTGQAPLDGSKLATKPLQIQATGDPQTPYQYHTSLSQPMQSRVVTVHGPGHAHFASGNKVVDDIGVHYLRTGEVTATDAPGLI